jgi:Phosphofructokinase
MQYHAEPNYSVLLHMRVLGVVEAVFGAKTRSGLQKPPCMMETEANLTNVVQENVMCAVVGIPKSIDNDILLVDRCFGFDTAVEEAQRALLAAKVEASSADHGIGLVKLMGRSSGFIALQVCICAMLV